MLNKIRKDIENFYKNEISLNSLSVKIYDKLKYLFEIKNHSDEFKEIISSIYSSWILIEEVNASISAKYPYLCRDKNKNNKILNDFNKDSLYLKESIKKIILLLEKKM